MWKILWICVFLFKRLAVFSSVEHSTDPMLYLPVSVERCHRTLMFQSEYASSQIYHNSTTHNAQFKTQLGIHGLISYLNLYHSCFKTLWTSCLSVDVLKVFNWTHIKSSKLCHGIHVDAYGQHGRFLHDLLTRPRWQINITFTKFVLRRSYAGCTKHHIQV